MNILSAYVHYRWRVHLTQAKSPFGGLKDNDKWQVPILAAKRRRFGGV